VIEFARRTREGRLSVWLFTFASAVVLVQGFSLLGWFDASDARQLSARSSLSGAAIGESVGLCESVNGAFQCRIAARPTRAARNGVGAQPGACG